MSASAVIGAVKASLGTYRGSRSNGSAETERGSCTAVSTGTAFYRKYTENLLRRYMRTLLDMGRCPSVLGNLTFRGKSSHSSVRNLEDAVIFVHDVETCLNKLDRGGRELLKRITLQDYTQDDVARMWGTSTRSVMRRHAEALDRLTEILLEVELLEVGGY